MKVPEYRTYLKTETYSVEDLDCADLIKVGEYIVVAACSSSGKALIYRRNDENDKMKLIYTVNEFPAAKTEQVVMIEIRGFFVDQIYVMIT